MSAAVVAAVALAGCDPDGVVGPASLRSLQPLSPALVADIEQKGMTKDSPILVRIFKEESELEVWKVDGTGRFALLKTYPICRWSGELGPKVKEGDRQTPEGFYTITPGLMNPNSNYYLAINMGFPNAYDRANGRSGDFLMIHGDCSSRGCYAMTDEQIAEIYALARESFFGGQRSFQIEAFPFRMTPVNMAKHRDSPHMAFWRMLKEGYDHFEVTRLEPKVQVCEKRYVFDADGSGFTPGGKCPAYRVKEEIAAAAKEKKQNDEREFAELVNRGTGTVPVRMGTDGGMHPIFLAAFERPHTDSAGVIRSPFVKLPGTIPSHTRPPGDPNAEPVTGSVVVASASSSGGGLFGNAFASSGSKDAPKDTSSDQSSGGIFGSMSRLFGIGGSEPAAPETPTKPKTKAAAKPTAVAAKATKPAAVAQAPAKPAPEAKSAASPPEEPQTKSASNSAVLSGAQRVVPTGSFESRWGGFQ